MRVVFDMPHHSPALLPWLSPELLRQVRTHTHTMWPKPPKTLTHKILTVLLRPQDLHGYGVKSDIYSLGIVACELVSGRVPFQDMLPTQVI